jgi:hypothetical protein
MYAPRSIIALKRRITCVRLSAIQDLRKGWNSGEDPVFTPFFISFKETVMAKGAVQARKKRARAASKERMRNDRFARKTKPAHRKNAYPSVLIPK